jgi:ABC-type lipoprotein export system ATPase subunit
MSDPSAPARPIIECRGVEKIYEDGAVHALRGLDLEVAPGELLTITGPSGCGKSTLLHLLAALDTPTAGSIRVGDYDLSRLRHPDRYRREEVGLVFQLHNLMPQLSAAGNVEVVMVGTHRRRHDRSAHARELLAAVDLLPLADRRPPQLSGGERQRVAIARALANDPSVLLADEPTGSLDSGSVHTVLRVFERLRDERGVTIVLVTHDENVARIADRMIEMLDGRVRQESTSSREPEARGPSALPLRN